TRSGGHLRPDCRWPGTLLRWPRLIRHRIPSHRALPGGICRIALRPEHKRPGNKTAVSGENGMERPRALLRISMIGVLAVAASCLTGCGSSSGNRATTALVVADTLNE